GSLQNRLHASIPDMSGSSASRMTRSGRISRAHSSASAPLAGWTTAYPFASSTRPREWSRTTVIRTIVGAAVTVTMRFAHPYPQQPGLGQDGRMEWESWWWVEQAGPPPRG